MFNYHSLRARKARLSKVLCHKLTLLMFYLGFIVTAVMGVYLLFLGASFGWLLIAVALAILMVLLWSKLELAKIPVANTNDLNDRLSKNLLKALPAQLTARDLAAAVLKTNSGRFLAVRYGISSELLTFVAGQLHATSVDSIFKAAEQIREQFAAEQLSGGMLTIALLQAYPDVENLLNRMKLSVSDLYDGVRWYNYLHGLVESSKKKRHTGGIARDLAFGYIPTLQRFGTNISMQRERAMKTQILQESHQEIIAQIIQIFSTHGRQNAALIGPAGSGRSTIITALAEELLDADNKLPSSLQFRQIFMLDAAALISVANQPGEMESLVSRILNEAHAAKNIIICLDNAHLFFENGVGSVDISNILLPVLEAGSLRMILTMDQQKYLEISAKNAALANALNKITVTPASAEETMKVMQDRVPVMEYQQHVTYTFWALKEAYRLSERYVHDLEMPGRALNLLEAAGQYPEGKFVTDVSVQRAVEQNQGVKLQSSTTAEDKTRLLNLEKLIHERMVDQERAVKAVSDALRRSAAGVRNENRPIGTFLFLGPTGVGKTELAKALGEVYFGGEDNLVRIDLNEYVEPKDVSRLIADGASDPLSLTAQIMKQPFSVVLLDEIEKAHPQVLTTLLQMLDEGILRDIKNQEVSFRDAIVIATSNADPKSFKPEFINRFDEICQFEPLSKENLVKIVDLIIAGVNKTLAPQKISVKLDEDAKLLLVEKGYDPEFGARPMRRIVQQTVENLVAKAMLSGAVESGAEVEITRELIEVQLGGR